MKLRNKLIPAAVMAAAFSGAAVSPADAATPPCGTSCVNIFSAELENGAPIGHNPSFVLDDYRRGIAAGNPVIMFRASNADPGQDFTFSEEGTVNQFFKAGLVSASLNLHYKHNHAYEIEYSPSGVGTSMCVGTAVTAGNGTPVSLQPCGVSSKTVWVAATGPASVSVLLSSGYVALINGSDTNFSHPYALNYPAGAFPTDNPRPQLQTWQVQQFSAPGSIYDNELWSASFGPLP